MFFKKKKKYEEVSMILSVRPDQQPVGYNVISDKLKISGKYYKFVPDCFDDVFKPVSNIALYIRAKYTGVYPTNFDYIISQYYSNLLRDVTKKTMHDMSDDVKDQMLYTIDYFKINFTELFDQTKEYSIEMDIKNGCPDVKHILHFHDNENEIEGFFVYYDSDFVDKKYQKWFENYIEFCFAARCRGYRGTLCH